MQPEIKAACSWSPLHRANQTPSFQKRDTTKCSIRVRLEQVFFDLRRNRPGMSSSRELRKSSVPKILGLARVPKGMHGRRPHLSNQILGSIESRKPLKLARGVNCAASRRPDRDVPFRSTGCLTKHRLQFHSMDMNGAILISELLMEEEANESNNGSTASNGQVAGAGMEVEGDGDGESHSHTCVPGALVAGGCGRRGSPCFSCPRRCSSSSTCV